MHTLVVGAGIAGPTLAYWLLEAGHEVTIVESAPRLRTGGYLIDFWGAGFDVAERMGIVPELRRRGYAVTEARVVDDAGRRVARLRPAALLGGLERYVSVPRSELAAAIVATLDDRAELILGDTVDALNDDDAGVHVTMRSGRQLDADLVIGADGLHSRVRQLMFGPEERYERYQGIVVAAFQAQGYRPRDELVALMHAGVGYQVLRVSLRDDRTLFLLTVRHTGRLPEGRDAQQDLFRTRLARAGWETPAILELMPRAEDLYVDAVSQIRMPSWSSGRVALVGDAAAAPSFLAGQGSALAMVEAYTLAAELSPGGNHAAAFARYHSRLAPLITSKQDASTRLGIAFAPASRLQLTLRNTVMRLMGLPKVPELVMGRSFRDAVELPAFGA